MYVAMFYVVHHLLIIVMYMYLSYISISMMNYKQKPDWKSNFPSFRVNYQKSMCNDSINKFLGPSNYVDHSV